MNVPDAIAALVPSLFSNPERPLYAAAATAGAGGAPQVRTVHYRYLPARDTISFACHTGSAKWKELQADDRVGGCWFHPKKQIQLRWSARALLITDATDPAFQTAWEETQDWLRAQYGEPSLFGVVALDIDLWDFYEIDLEDPRKSRRRVWRREADSWREESRSALI